MTDLHLLRSLGTKLWIPFEGLGGIVFWVIDGASQNGMTIDQFGLPTPILPEPPNPPPPQPAPTKWELRIGGMVLALLLMFVFGTFVMSSLMTKQ